MFFGEEKGWILLVLTPLNLHSHISLECFLWDSSISVAPLDMSCGNSILCLDALRCYSFMGTEVKICGQHSLVQHKHRLQKKIFQTIFFLSEMAIVLKNMYSNTGKLL